MRRAVGRLLEQRVAEAEADLQLRASSNSGCVASFGIDAFVEVVDRGDVVDEPTGEERRECEFGEHHQIAPLARRLLEEHDHPLDDVGSGVGELDRAELGAGDGDDACHGGILAATCTSRWPPWSIIQARPGRGGIHDRRGSVAPSSSPSTSPVDVMISPQRLRATSRVQCPYATRTASTRAATANVTSGCATSLARRPSGSSTRSASSTTTSSGACRRWRRTRCRSGDDGRQRRRHRWDDCDATRRPPGVAWSSVRCGRLRR